MQPRHDPWDLANATAGDGGMSHRRARERARAQVWRDRQAVKAANQQRLEQQRRAAAEQRRAAQQFELRGQVSAAERRLEQLEGRVQRIRANNRSPPLYLQADVQSAQQRLVRLEHQLQHAQLVREEVEMEEVLATYPATPTRPEQLEEGPAPVCVAQPQQQPPSQQLVPPQQAWAPLMSAPVAAPFPAYGYGAMPPFPGFGPLAPPCVAPMGMAPYPMYVPVPVPVPQLPQYMGMQPMMMQQPQPRPAPQ